MRARRRPLSLLVITLSAGLAWPAGAAGQVLGDGAWSYFGDPRAVHHRGLVHRTYTGWTDRAGAVVIAAHGPGYMAEKVVAHLGYVNDHSNPSLLMRPDRRLMVFYSRHSGGAMFYRVASAPESISRWGNERVVTTNTPGGRGYTYPNPVHLKNQLFLFWRGGDWEPTYSRIVGGNRWARARTVIRGAPGQRPYVKYAPDGRGRVLMAFNAGHPRGTDSSLYFASFNTRESVFRASGDRIATRARLPISPEQADLIHGMGDTGLRSWVQDVAATRSGRPVIVYAVFPSPGHHQYRYATWNGRRWTHHTIVKDSGPSISSDLFEEFYAGGVTLDHNDPSIVYLSRRVGKVNEIEMRRTHDGGRTWSRTQVTSNSTTDNVRPVSPRGLHPGESEVIWLRGRYGRYRAFGTSVYRKPPWADPLLGRWSPDSKRPDLWSLTQRPLVLVARGAW